MYYEKKTILMAFLLASLAGIVLHFVYHWVPSPLVAIIAPVSESLWEHSKLIFYPGLVAAVVLSWNRPKGLAPWLLAVVASCVAMLAVAYFFHIILDMHSLPFDIGLYFASMFLLFWLAPRLDFIFQGRWTWVAIVLAVGFWVLLVIFSFAPPQGNLFQNHAASAYSMCGYWE